MSSKRMGQVVPFVRSPEAIRRSALKNARRSPADAIELTRHLARQEDRPADWLRLAQQLQAASCYEQATEVLCQLLGREDAPEDAWLELGRCMNALYEGAVSLPAPQEGMPLPMRGEKLLHRAFHALESGETALAKKRFRRCLHLPDMAPKVYHRLALHSLSHRDMKKALLYSLRAVKSQPEDLSAQMLLYRLMFAAGYPRAAMAGIIRCEKDCETIPQVQSCVDTLRLFGAWKEAEAFLTRRLARTPYRAVLLRQLAEAAWHLGKRETALQAAQRLLRVDPMDTEALTLCNWHRERPETAPGFGPELRKAAFEVHRPHLMRLALSQDEPEGFLSPESETRRALDWAFCRGLPPMQEIAAAGLICRCSKETRRYIRQVLMLPSAHPNVKTKLIDHLRRLNDPDPVRVMSQGRVLTVDCARRLTEPMKFWPLFLRRYLGRINRLNQNSDAVLFARERWQGLTHSQREDAAIRHPQEWVYAMELAFLMMTGQMTPDDMTKQDVSRRTWRCIFALVRDAEGTDDAYPPPMESQETQKEG